MGAPATPPSGARSGGIAADLANLGHLLDVLDQVINERHGGAPVEPRYALRAERDSARLFLRSLLTEGLQLAPREVWTRESADRLGASISNLLDAARSFQHEQERIAGDWNAGRDTRQPGAVPGPTPGDLPSGMLEVPAFEPGEAQAIHAAEIAFVDATPAPAYRAPLAGTIPPKGREFRCDSCGRAFAGHVMAGCPCGGSITIIDPEPDEPTHRQVSASWQYGIDTPSYQQEERGKIECSCGMILTDIDAVRLRERWDAHARLEGS